MNPRIHHREHLSTFERDYAIPEHAPRFGGGGGNSGANQAAQTSANTQAAALNQIQQLIGSQQGIFDQSFLPLISALGDSLPGFLSAPTNIAQAAPSLTSFFTNEMNTGINPTFALNAQNQLSQNFDQSLNTIRANTAPGQNPNASIMQLQDNLLSQSANLGGQLAGESQQFSNQGAAGLGTLATQLDSATLAKLGPLLQFISQGLGIPSSSIGALGGVYQGAGNSALGFSNLAAQEAQQQQSGWGSIFGGLLGAGAGAMTGGAAGPGGFGAILKGFSDERLKRDIVPFGRPVEGMQPVAFTWRDTGERDVGLVAQDVEREHPEWVERTREGLRVVDYGRAMEPFARRLAALFAVPAYA